MRTSSGYTCLLLLLLTNLFVGLSPGAADVIIDNGQPGTSFTGVWSVSAGTGAYGTDSLWGRNGATYTWQTDQLDPGFYDVFMWWTQYTSRTDAAPVTITHGSGQASLTVNQQIDGSLWVKLGTYYFNTSGSVTITGNGVFPQNTCADAVRFTTATTPPPELTTVIDNTDTANTSRIGTWSVSGGVGAYGTNSLYCRNVNSSFSWRFTPTETSYYQVFMWWTEFSSRSAVTPVEVQNADGTASMTVNQQTSGGRWNLLGEYLFNAGTTYLVTVRTLADRSAICADAVCFFKTSTTPPPPPPPTGTIIDNTDTALTARVGSWPVSAGLNPWGTNSVYSRAPNASFSWLFTPAEDGYYNVSMWWTDSTSRSTAAPVEIQNGDGTALLTVNQMTNVGMWNLLGEYPFYGGTTYRITIYTLTDNSSVCADAVLFEKTATPPPPPPPPPSGTIIDNRDADTSSVGTWAASAGVNPYGVDSVWCRSANCSFTWLFTPAETAYYDVSMWWTDSTSRCTAAPVEIQNAGGTAQLTVNQLANSATWNVLGNYLFNAGTTYQVTIRTLADNTSICADAVRFEQSAPPPPPDETVIDNTDAATERVGSWVASGAAGFYGTNSLYCRAPNASFTWLFTPTKTSNYEVSMWWTVISSRSTAAPIEIETADGVQSLTANQQLNGGMWNVLGKYLFNEGVTYRVTVRTITDLSSICADAVRFVETTAPPPPPPTGFIIDNTDTTTEIVGKWPASAGLNPYGTNSVYCRAPNASFTWLFTPAEDGYYNVFMWWTDSTSRSTAAPVEIENVDGTGSLTVNQMTNVGMWNLLGEYPFYGGTTYRITIYTLTDNSSVCADAVMFEKTSTPPPPPPPPPSGIIIDNNDPNTSRVGTWPVSGGINAWGTDSLYCRTADCSFTWLFTPDTTGFYNVSMWWTEFSSRSAVTPVEIQHAGGTESLTVNQQTGGNAWNSLGSFLFSAGTTYSVTIRTLADSSAVCADAVRFEPVEMPADTIIDNTDPQVSSVGTWPVSGAPDWYGTNSVYCRDANASFTWQFTPAKSGLYQVSMWWTYISSRSAAAPVEIQNASGTASLTVNQLLNAGMWNVLGEYQFEQGQTYNVTIRTLTDRTSICADAVKFTMIVQ
ncbi:MAG: hypothetical protein LLF76_02220 [Planctomycetaceae bacterium]|nr:hypothetical protein [Planctomycetaceae bacterium]